MDFTNYLEHDRKLIDKALSLPKTQWQEIDRLREQAIGADAKEELRRLSVRNYRNEEYFAELL